MSGGVTLENERNRIAPVDRLHTTKPMSRIEEPTAEMAEAHPSKLSPTSTKSRSVPSTPSQRPQSPPGRRTSPHTMRAGRDGSPQSLRTAASRTPPAQRRGGMCKYETGMTQARRRVPYTLGPEKLEADPEKAAKILNAKEEFRLTAEMEKLYTQLLPTVESEERRRKLVEKLERLLRDRWPGQSIKVSVFGSTGNRLGTNDSDVDICITTDYRDIEHVCSLADLLARNGMERVVCVSSAKVPIVKVWDPELQVACDMNVNNPIALENTELIRSYVAIDGRFRPLAMIVKHWAKRRILNDAALGGTLSAYTWICLVLNFLQTRDPPILPSLQQAPNLEPRYLNGVNVAFDKDLVKYEGFGKQNTCSLGQLLFQFFRYYGHELDFEQKIISVRLGKVISKSQKAWHLLQDNRLCVEEPFNVSRNLGNTADDTSVRGIHLEMRRACDLLAEGHLIECCEQFVPTQSESLPRRTDTFIHPTTKAIIPQPPPQPLLQPLRPNRSGFKNKKRGELNYSGGRRASNPPGRTTANLRDTHLRDLPFPMTPQELQLQAQHQQHLLHDQLFQQYQYLQMQEQELRMQLYRQRGLLAASGYPSSAFSGTDSTDDGQESSISSRTNASSRVPLTAPLYQSRFNVNSSFLGNGGASSGIVTNPASPLLTSIIPDSRRYARRASVNNTTASTLRAQSQPARVVASTTGFPHLVQRFEVPVRQVTAMGSRRTSVNSSSQDTLAGYLPGRFRSQGTRYDAGRRPVEYVGYYVGQSPSLSAYAGSATISPVPSTAGLAIHNGGLSPRLSTRSSRLPSVSTSPASHYASLANGATTMTSVTENGPVTEVGLAEHTPPSVRSGPLVVDGSINSPPRRQTVSRPDQSSSEELDVSVTTSEDAAVDTPPCFDEMTTNRSIREEVANGSHPKSLKHFGDVMHESDFLSLNSSKMQGLESHSIDDDDASAALRNIEQERLLLHLTNGLVAANGKSHGFMSGNAVTRKPRPTNMNDGQQGQALAAMTNGNHTVGHLDTANGGHEWQVQSKKKKKGKKCAKQDPQENNGSPTGGEALPKDELMRKGG